MQEAGPQMREIPLKGGRCALVDDSDFAWLSQFDWQESSGYASRRFGFGRKGSFRIYMHQLICPVPPGKETDHINGGRLDNRRANLRPCTRSENLSNKRKRSGACLSQYKGVTFDKKSGRWQASIMHRRKAHYLGRYGSEVEAAKAYNHCAEIIHGEFAQLNVITA